MKQRNRTRDEVVESLDVRSEHMLSSFEGENQLARAHSAQAAKALSTLARHMYVRDFSLREIAALVRCSHTKIQKLVRKPRR